MTAITAAHGAAAGPRLEAERLRGVFLWLMAFAGGFVFIEPGPYEVVGILTLFIFGVTGLSLNAALAPLVLLLTLLNLGYALSLFRIDDIDSPVIIWVLVSVFLAITAIFFAGMLSRNTQTRLQWLMGGYIAAAVVVSLLAIAGYFRLLGGASDMFVIFSRAKGTFKDPNVFSAFLVLPALLILRRMLAGRQSQLVGGALMLLPIVGGLFLSFSRAAWGQLVFGAVILMALTFITSTSSRERLRIITVALIGALLFGALIVALLSVEKVATLFHERFALTQGYDTGHTGRFGRYSLAIDMLLDYPLGLGPLQFLFPEAPHNTYLNSFITGGWLSGAAYLTLTLVTFTAGLRFAFVATPWQPIFHAVYAAYVGVMVESFIIDSDHWRHYFLIVGLLWGLMAVSREYRRAPVQSLESAPEYSRRPG